MAPKNLVSRKRRQQDEEQTLNHPNEEQSDQRTDSDPDLESEAAEEVAAPPKKTKSTKPLKLAGPEPLENGSACSSPSASGFLIVPSQKPSGEKEEKKMKKAHASKVFSHDDVIAMLKGLAEFWANGRNNKWAEFHLFIKDVLRNQFTKIQVSEKIRSLKRKFDTNLERARANGGHIDLADPHELAVFELSKALWSNDEKGIAPEKVLIAENDNEKENEMRGERKKVSDNDEGKKSMKKRKKLGDNEGSKSAKKKKKQVDGSDEESKSMKKKKQVDESDEESKSMKKHKQVDESDEESKGTKKQKQVDESREVSKKEKNRKQLGETGEENKKMSKLDHGIEELVGGDERDAANTILSIRKMVNGHGEGIKKKKKRKQVDEHDENRELLEGGIQKVNGHDEANKTPSKSKHIDERGKGNKKKRKHKQVDELDEANKTGEQKEVDEPDEANKTGELKEVDEPDEANKTGEQKEVDEPDEANKTGELKEVDELDEQKGVDELDEANKTGEQKEVDEHVEKKEIVEKAHKVDLHVKGEHANEHEEQGMTTRKKKRADGDKGLAKKRKDASGHHEENNMPANHKQEMRIRAEDFQSAYPLLYASFHTSRYPRFNKGNCTLIGQENALELEEKWRELNAEMHRLELKKLDLMMRDSHRLPGK